MAGTACRGEINLLERVPPDNTTLWLTTELGPERSIRAVSELTGFRDPTLITRSEFVLARLNFVKFGHYLVTKSR